MAATRPAVKKTIAKKPAAAKKSPAAKRPVAKKASTKKPQWCQEARGLQEEVGWSSAHRVWRKEARRREGGCQEAQEEVEGARAHALETIFSDHARSVPAWSALTAISFRACAARSAEALTANCLVLL